MVLKQPTNDGSFTAHSVYQNRIDPLGHHKWEGRDVLS
jgi:hypothetical protein